MHNVLYIFELARNILRSGNSCDSYNLPDRVREFKNFGKCLILSTYVVLYCGCILFESFSYVIYNTVYITSLFGVTLIMFVFGY